MTLIDGLVVIGGGLAAAHSLFFPRLVEEMNGTLETLDGRQIPRMELKAFNLEDEAETAAFIRGDAARNRRARLEPQSDLRPVEADRRRPFPPGHQPGGRHRGVCLRLAHIGKPGIKPL